MKKTYQKPELYFEDFTMLDALATCDSGPQAHHADKLTCVLDDTNVVPPGLALFNNPDICTISELEFFEIEHLSPFSS